MRKSKFKIFLIIFLVLILVVVGIFLIVFSPDQYHKTIILEGTIVTPDEIIEHGYVVVKNGKIQKVSSQKPIFSNSVTIDTRGIIFPGLIDLHNHVPWNVIPRWQPDYLFLNRYEWRFGNENYQKIDAVFNSLRSEYFFEMNTYGEVRALIGGATSIVGSGPKLCIRGLVRNLDFYSGFYTLPIIRDYAHIRNYIDLPVDAGKIHKFLSDDTSEAFFIHLAEGTDSASRAEFDKLNTLGLLSEKTVIIHGMALEKEQFRIMSDKSMSLIWSPRSNIELYGQTADIISAIEQGVTIAIAPDWALTGSSNMLDELHISAEWNSLYLNNRLSDKQLVEMVTKIPAKIAGISDEVGTISEGMYADLLVISGDTQQPYRSLVEANSVDVKLVLINGVPVYGDHNIMELFFASMKFTGIEIMGVTKALLLPDFPALVTGLEQALSPHGLELAPLVDTIEMRLPKAISHDH